MKIFQVLHSYYCFLIEICRGQIIPLDFAPCGLVCHVATLILLDMTSMVTLGLNYVHRENV